MFIGLLIGLAFSVSVVRAADDASLAAHLPRPVLTACIGLLVIVAGWITASATPRFAAGLAAAAAPGAIYASMRLAWDGEHQLAYSWSAIAVAVGCLAIGAGLHAAHHRRKPWSARRSSSPRIPRARTR